MPDLTFPGKIGVVTVLYNSSSVLPGFFRSIESQDYPEFTVFCVDNASTDTSATECEGRGPMYTVIRNLQNQGVARGNNQGILAAIESGCEYILLLNNDVEFGPTLFRDLKEGLAENDCSMTTPIMYYFDQPHMIWAAGGKFQPLFGYRCYHLEEGVVDDRRHRDPMRVEESPTCAVLFHREVFARIGLMDERYFVYHDDTDFMLRAYKAGEKLFLLPQAKLWHKVSSLTGAGSDFSVRFGTRNRAYMLTKFCGRLLALPYIAMLWMTYIARVILKRDPASQLSLRRRCLFEGFSMASNWLPYRF